ncbi:amyloid fiber anchoring/assembly protein TapA [Bacillus glycinifermentans]|uniref:amyloid fiber anchoring/assembly protein TapA n=1 Tax=Bacillus glycinifermentans TaxID=1664069 RepID=UPI001FF1ADED|nr:amyloid fiber anchoring/assembly protein TapA [Bacillus glycinifermentans]UOY89793.1 amyloid fiber anchoring/assembly protein TapA [Bacillus glycinifermentans]
MIRLSRTRRCRKRSKKAVIGFQMILIIYLLIGLGSQLNQYTNASFHDMETYSLTMKASAKFKDIDDKVWDGSDLKLHKQTKTKGNTCAPLVLFAEFKNSGKHITSSEWKWELHKIDDSSKPKDGTVIDKGTIGKEAKSRVYRIESNRATKGGTYVFKLIKPEGHPDDKRGKPFIWSKAMKLNDCKEKTPKPPKKAESHLKSESEKTNKMERKQQTKGTDASQSVHEEKDKEKHSLESGDES